MANANSTTFRSLSRQELQQLCKENNIRANLKTDELIKLLDEYVQAGNRLRGDVVAAEEQEQSRSPSPVEPVVSARTRSGTRTVTTSSRRTTRTSSLLIHPLTPPPVPDPPEIVEESDSEVKGKVEAEKENKKMPKNRKAKETQKRLGVGKPRIAGGQGPRVATKVPVVPVRTSSRRQRGQDSATQLPSSQESVASEQPQPQPRTRRPQAVSSSHVPSLDAGTYLHLDALIEEPEGELELSNVSSRDPTIPFPTEPLSFTADNHHDFAALALEQAQSSTPGPSRPRISQPAPNLASSSASSQDLSSSAVSALTSQVQELWKRTDTTVSKLSSHEKETISLRDDLNVTARNQEAQNRDLVRLRRALTSRRDKGKGKEGDVGMDLERVDELEDKVASLEDELKATRMEHAKTTEELEACREKLRMLEQNMMDVMSRMEQFEQQQQKSSTQHASSSSMPSKAPSMLGKRSAPLDSPFPDETDDRPESRFKRRRVDSDEEIDPHTPPSHPLYPLETPANPLPQSRGPHTPPPTLIPSALHEPSSPTTDSPRRGEKGKGREKEGNTGEKETPVAKKPHKSYHGFDPDTRTFHATSGTPAFPPVSPYYHNGVPRLLPAWNFDDAAAAPSSLAVVPEEAGVVSTMWGTEAERFEGIFGEYGQPYERNWLSGAGASGAAWSPGP